MTTLIVKLFLDAFKRLFILFVSGAISAAAVIPRLLSLTSLKGKELNRQG